ncbi:MAG: M24 family metallopeptidase [Candidatus Thorarchaeota archaeon]
MTFTEQEFMNRYARAHELMDDKELDALLVTEKSNYCYFTAHRSIGWVTKTRPIVLILPRNGDPVLVVHEWEIGNSKANCPWIKDIRTWIDLPFSISPLLEVFQDLKLTSSRIGAELGYEQRLNLPLDDFERLKKEMPKAQFVDGSDVFWRVRSKKSKAEIEKIRKACDCMSVAIEKTYDEVSVGMTERDVARILYVYMMNEGADIPGVVAICGGPESYEQESHTPADNTLQSGNVLFIDGGCIYDEYWSDMSRMAVLGQPSEKQKKMHKLFSEATDRHIEMVRPGVKASEIAKTCMKFIRDSGLATWGVGRMGHGIGLNFTEPPSIMLNDDTPLEEGMVLTIEPGTITPYGIFCLEEVIVVTEDGSEIISTANKNLVTL